MKKQWILQLPSQGCALFMLCVLPLLFRNAFFDINRFKVAAVCGCVPPFALAAIAVGLLKAKKFRANLQSVCASDVCMLVLMIACTVSCWRTGFDSASLTGSEGRYCGLWFMLACSLAYFVIRSGGRLGAGILIPAIITADLVAVIGCLNAAGVDPLGFYARLANGQEAAFISTIGNINFFGAYLVLLMPLAATYALFSERNWQLVFGGFSCMIILLGIAASRTDSALLGTQLAFLVLLAFAGSDFRCMERVMLLWAFSFAALPVMQQVMARGSFSLEMTGAMRLLCSHGAAWIIGAFFLGAAVICVVCNRCGVNAPGRKVMFSLSLALFILFAAISLIGIGLFTWAWPDAELGSAATFLRFNDSWGSLRGFVFKRSLRAYNDFSLGDKLFGGGLDLARRILTPYFDDPAMLSGGVFTDAHCQPLQLLITCGLFGAAAFAGLWITSIKSVLRNCKGDLLSIGLFAALIGYLPIMLLSVTQPILISSLFSFCALAVSRSRAPNHEGGLS